MKHDAQLKAYSKEMIVENKTEIRFHICFMLNGSSMFTCIVRGTGAQAELSNDACICQ